MTINECNPFIRYAVIDKHKKRVNDYRVLLDNRIIYVLEGKCNLKFKDIEYTLNKDDMFYMPSGTVFNFLTTKNANLIILCFDFDQLNCNKKSLALAIPEKKFDSNKLYGNLKFTDYTSLNNRIVLKNVPFLKKYFMNITRDFTNKKSLFLEKCSANLKLLICSIAEKEIQHSNDQDNRINDILSYIDNHYGERINNNSICKVIGYHPYYLNNLTRLETGHTIHWHLMKKRVSASKELLTNTELSISDIATRCGFSSQTHFSNSFKNYTNTSPKDYRNNYNFYKDNIL